MSNLLSRKIILLVLVGSVTLLAGNAASFADQPAAAPAAGPVVEEEGGIETVLVTARRRSEDPQKTPIAVTALSAEDLQTAGVQSVYDLSTTVPGVHLFASGTPDNTVFSIRGMSRGAVGNEQSAVQVYVNDVPLSSWGASVPTYDLENVQVLKGAQGTLFGINASSGAILLDTKAPGYDFGGYLQATVGNYRWNQYEGAVNIPLIDNKLAVRVAGQIALRNGYTANLSFPGHDFDDVDHDAFRVSVLANPTDWLKNTLVFDYLRSHTSGAGIVLYSWDNPAVNPAFAHEAANSIPWLNGAFYGIGPQGPIPCNNQPICNIGLQYAQQLAAGPRGAYTPLLANLQSRHESVTDTAIVDLGMVQVKNIFGYRTVYDNQFGFEVAGTQSPTVGGSQLVDIKQYSDELQLSGHSFRDTLTWIAGLFYLDSVPNGLESQATQVFNPPGTPFKYAGPQVFPGVVLGGNGSDNYFHDSNKAAYGQVNYKLGGLMPALDGLSVDAGVRYSKDNHSVCAIGGQFAVNPPLPESACTGSEELATSSNRTTYTVGLNYQATKDVLLYAVTRSGYRTGGINYPGLLGNLTPYQTWQPESVRDIEVGLKSDWHYQDMFGRFNLAAFHSEYNNVHGSINTSGINQLLPNGVDGTGKGSLNIPNPLFYTNVGIATVQGLEVEAIVEPLHGLQLTAEGAWYHKTIDQISFNTPAAWLAGGIPAYGLSPASIAFYGDPAGVVFDGAPAFTYSFALNYTLPLPTEIGALVFNAQYFRTSDSQYEQVNAAAWGKLDLRLSWNSILRSPLDLALFVTNVSNQIGINGSSLGAPGFGITSVIYNEPRMYGAQLRYHFGKQ